VAMEAAVTVTVVTAGSVTVTVTILAPSFALDRLDGAAAGDTPNGDAAAEVAVDGAAAAAAAAGS